MTSDELSEIDLELYFGGGGHLDALREANPIPEFDDIVEFYEYVVVDNDTRCKVEYPIDHDTGECDRTALPPNTHVAEHRYFVNKAPQPGSATGYVHHFFPEFDGEGAARKIAQSNRMLLDEDYKYFEFAKNIAYRAWQLVRGKRALAHEFDFLYSCLASNYACPGGPPPLPNGDLLIECPTTYWASVNESLRSGDGNRPAPHPEHRYCKVFDRLYRAVIHYSLLACWREISEDALTRGRLMHRSIEMCYNSMYDPQNERFHVPEMQQFARFHRNFVLGNKLRMLRTELCLAHKPDPQLDVYLCGMIDAVFIDAQGNVWLGDWKRSKEIKTRAFNPSDVGTGPCRGLQDCNREQYNMQLNVYRYIFEANTKYRVVKSYIIVFHPLHEDYELYLVPDYQSRVAEALDDFVAHKRALEQHADASKHEQD